MKKIILLNRKETYFTKMISLEPFKRNSILQDKIKNLKKLSSI